MTPKDKANVLVSKYCKISRETDENPPIFYAKKCALICVDEILFEIPEKTFVWTIGHVPNEKHEYWRQVKTEIENL